MRVIFGVICGVIGGYIAFNTITAAVNTAAAAVSAAVMSMP